MPRLKSAKIGAAVAHIHVRHPDGRPSMELAHYREVVDRIREKNSELIINLTTGPGGRFVPDKDDPRIAGPGTTLLHPLKRVEHIVALKPDIATLDLNTMWSGTAAVINTPENVTIMANAIQEAGSKPNWKYSTPATSSSPMRCSAMAYSSVHRCSRS